MRDTVSAVAASALGLAALVFPGAPARGGEAALGRTLFQREFRPNDPRCHNGDGLGPVYNASSCVACHHLGGSGGAGSNRHNVELVRAVSTGGFCAPGSPQAAALVDSIRLQTGLPPGATVLHRTGSGAGYVEWKAWLLSRGFDGIKLVRSERNTPALFGAGLIDAIPDAAIEARAARPHPGFQGITGRVSRLKGGQVGRFGWKGQIARLDDFVRTACSAELGLEVPGHHQSIDPSDTTPKAAELDLTEAECRALVAYVAGLPAPALRLPTRRAEADRVYEGAALFKTVGCAECHTPTLGDVSGIYSDLLLHDLGEQNEGSGSYSSPEVEVPDPSSMAAVAGGVARPLGATSREWRTPPLWGLRDSFPYMHDGKARTVEDAVARHGGEATDVLARFRKLSGAEKVRLLSFLGSLAAPPDAERVTPAPERAVRPRTTPAGATALRGPGGGVR